MDTLSYKTISANKETAHKEWVVVDATDQVVGRLGSKSCETVERKSTNQTLPLMLTAVIMLLSLMQTK